MVLFVLEHVLGCAAIAATAWSAGAILCRHLDDGTRPVPQSFILACGIAALGQTCLLLAFLGLLTAPLTAAAAIAVNAAAWRHWSVVMPARRDIDAKRAVVVGALALPPFILTLYPPLGFDQTLYHLPYARAFAATARLPFLPALRFPVFPQLHEALNAGVLLLADDVATQAVGWLALMACAGLAWAWARELAAPAAGALAAVAIVGSPITINLAATGYVDPMLGLFGLASLYAAERAAHNRTGWVFAAAALAGSAAAVKYLGLYFLPVCLLLIVRREASRALPRHVWWYSLGVTLAAAPTYARLVAFTGNPLFPFYPQWFGTSAWDAQDMVAPSPFLRFRRVATLLWDITFRRMTVGGHPFWSPVFVFGAPLVGMYAFQSAQARWLLLIAVGYMLLAPVDAHYFLGIAPLWSVLIAVSAWHLARVVPRRDALLSIAAVIGVVCGADAYTAFKVYTLGPPPASAEARERLLAARLPLYPAIAVLNRQQPSGVVYGVYAEEMVDYYSGTLLGDHNGPASFARVAQRTATLNSLAAAVSEVGASVVLMPAGQEPWHTWATKDVRLERIYFDGAAAIYRRR